MCRFTNGEVQHSQETDGAPRMISASLSPGARAAKSSIHLPGQYTTQVRTMSNIKKLERGTHKKKDIISNQITYISIYAELHV